jgi:hypothetical protein
MSEIVFVLGAGASKSAGAPLMNEFFDTAEDLLAKNRFGEDSDLIKKTFTCIDFLQKVYSKSYVDLNNLEQVFGLIELGYLLDLNFDNKESPFEEYRKSILRLIIRTIEEKGIIKIRSCPGDYSHIIKFIQKNNGRKISFITFNYDYFLEISLIMKQISFNYSFDDLQNSSQIPIYKLHGSLNWAICKESLTNNEIIIPIYNESLLVAPILFTEQSDLKTIASKQLKIGFVLEKGRKKYEVIQENPFLIPPTWNKMAYNKDLKNIWHNAAIELRDAKYLLIIGYSLPETDSFFKYLLALGTLSDARIRKFLVINPDNKCEAKYREIIGKGIEDRFLFIPKKLNDLQSYLAENKLDQETADLIKMLA